MITVVKKKKKRNRLEKAGLYDTLHHKQIFFYIVYMFVTPPTRQIIKNYLFIIL